MKATSAARVSPFSDVTFEAMRATLRRITYKPNFQLRLDERFDDGGGSYRIRADMTAPDAHAPGYNAATQRFSSYWTQTWPPSLDIFVLQVHAMLVEMERHEASEWFRFDGQAVVNPHDDRLAYRPFGEDPTAREAIRKLLRKPVTVDPRDATPLPRVAYWIDDDSPFTPPVPR